MHQRHAFATCVVVVLGCALAGCQTGNPRSVATTLLPRRAHQLDGLTLVDVDPVEAQCAPPVGWHAEPLKRSGRHTHQVWLSPSGKTAYGVIHFKLPFPANVNFVHWAFLRQMKNSEGDAIALSQHYDPNLPGLRFEAEGGLYRLRANLIVQGFEGWAVYAGTLRKDQPVPAELELAIEARENTVVGMPAEASISD